MKIISFIFVSLIFISCFQNQDKKSTKTDSPPKSLTADTVFIIDSTLSSNYSVDIDTVYFYASPDSNTKTGTYLTKNESIVIYQKNGEFGYAVPIVESSIESRGWLKLKYLKQIFFTPPKIYKE